jgi:hypothetical protein
VVIAAAWAATAAAPRETPVMLPLSWRLLRRFDLTLLGVVAVFAAVRTADRIGEDAAAGWLEPYCGSGGSRRGYPVSLTLAIGAPAVLLFAAGSSVFAAAVFAADGTAELVAGMPRLLAAGTLLLLVVIAYVALVGVFLRDPFATLAVAGVFAAAPYAAAAAYIARHGMVRGPWLLRIWVEAALPVWPAGGAGDFVRQFVWLAVLAGAGTAASRQLTGRRS